MKNFAIRFIHYHSYSWVILIGIDFWFFLETMRDLVSIRPTIIFVPNDNSLIQGRLSI